jgi:hypothetical protein
MEPDKDREIRSFLYYPQPLSMYIKQANIVVDPGDELNIVYGGQSQT